MPRMIVALLCCCLIGLGVPTSVAAENNATASPAIAQPATPEAGDVAKGEVAEEKAAGDEQPKESKSTEAKESDGEDEATAKQAAKQPEAKEEKADKGDDAADKKKEASKKEKPKALKKHKVEQKPLKIEVELDGVFISREMEEVVLRPKIWAQFKVIEAVEHGTRVKKGDVLVRFDDTKIEEALTEKSLDQRLGELSLMASEEEFPRLEESAELNYKDAQRKRDQLVEDYERFQKTLRPLSEKIAKFNFRYSKESLVMAEEELNQLQKMYEADEITEETEEIVLRRQRFAVEMAKLRVEYAKYNYDYTMGVSLLRREETMTEALKKSRLTLERAKMAKSLGLSRERYELEKKRQSRVRNVERHAKLLGDRALMVLRSPADGVVYYGQCVAGKWSSVASLRAKLKPFGTVSAKSVLMTIVDEHALSILSTVKEKDLPEIREGFTVCIIPTGDDKLELKGKVAEVSAFPVSSGKFSTQIEFDESDSPEWLVPGMTCKAKVTTYENEEAIQIPSDLVQTDEENEKRKYVMVYDEDEDETVRRKVKLGHSKGKMVEIVKGLEAGELIVKETKEKD